jgi:uncharacterized protein involved in tolerance to divalent cations
MTGIVSVYATFSNDEEASRIGRIAVEERLAACVNILGPAAPSTDGSGKVEEAEEVAAIFKVTAGQAALLISGLVSSTATTFGRSRLADQRSAESYRRWVVENSGGKPVPSLKRPLLLDLRGLGCHLPAQQRRSYEAAPFHFQKRSGPMKALMKTTKSAKPAEVEKKWHLIDADGLVVGRLASIANILRGKHKPSYTPHVDCGDHVVVINATRCASPARS